MLMLTLTRYTSRSSETTRIHSQFSISRQSSSSSSSSQVDEHFYGVSVTPLALACASPFTMPSMARQESNGINSSDSSKSIHPHKENTYVKILAEDSAENLQSGADPAKIDARLIRQYLDIFFDQANISALDLLPRGRFMAWALDCTGKSMVDTIMLYALMSWASFRCNRSESVDHRAIFKATVYRELELLNSERCLQSAHALLFLAFTEYGDHQYQAGSEAFAMSVDTMRLLELNVEQVCREDVRAYGLSAGMDAECRRRTFWAAFCFDSHLQLENSSLEVMNHSGITIKSSDEIELDHSGWLLQQPCLESDRGLWIPSTAREGKMLSNAGHIIRITRIHSDIVSNVSRVEAITRSSNRFPDDHAVRRHFHHRLNAWACAYNNTSHYQSATCSKDIGGLNMMYYSSQMELNRRIWYRGLSKSDLSSYARDATLHALAALILAEPVVSRGGSKMRDHLFVS